MGRSINSHTGHELYANVLESDLHQHVTRPTRGNSILDLILSTSDNLVNKVNVGPLFSTSDHHMITLSIALKANKVKDSKDKVLDYQKANFTKLRSILNDMDWSEIEIESNIDKMWEAFTTKLKNAVNTCVPYRNRRSPTKNNKPKWWNNDIKNILSLKKMRIQQICSNLQPIR